MATDDPVPPLISPRSPSYERSRRELAHPSPTGDPIVVALLNHLVEAEHDAARAFGLAADAVQDETPPIADRLRDQAAERVARAQALGELVASLGGSSPREGEHPDVLTHGASEIARLVGEEAILTELNELRAELAAAYAQATQDERVPVELRAAIAQLAPGAT